MKTHLSALVVLLTAFGFNAAMAEPGPFDPPGWYLEGANGRAGPFGSQGLCADLLNRQTAPQALRCVHYDRHYWLVVDQGGRTAAVTSTPFASLTACQAARVRMPVADGRPLVCTRRTPDFRPPPGTASLPGTTTTAMAQ